MQQQLCTASRGSDNLILMLLRSVAQSFSILGTKWQAETMHSVLKRKERMTLTFFT